MTLEFGWPVGASAHVELGDDGTLGEVLNKDAIHASMEAIAQVEIDASTGLTKKILQVTIAEMSDNEVGSRVQVVQSNDAEATWTWSD